MKFSDFHTPLEVFNHWESNTPQSIFLKQPVNGRWHSWTYQQAGVEIRKIASAIDEYKLNPGSNIAILSKNCAHWIMADLAIWMAGHVSVPLYPTLSPDTIKQILEHSDSKILFVGKLDNFAYQRAGIPSKVRCISFSLYGEAVGSQWDDLIVRHQPLQNYVGRDPNELATIKYTSGTTGNPKGVMISFAALHYITAAALKGLKLLAKGQRFFSYLPLSHIAERMLVEMGGIYSGATIYFTESLEKFPQNLREVQPTVFLGVPRIWAKFREKIEEKMPNLDKLLKIPLVSTIIKKVIRKKLGLSKTVWRFTGAASISVDLLAWFQKLDITINDVYGMTENLAYSHINLNDVRFGTAGRAWEDVLLKFSEEGEILMKHNALMLGYYREPDLTAQVFTSDGFLKTGDKGELDKDGFLTITGRIKDQFKTDKAKFVDPTPIEIRFMSNVYIEQVCVVGSGLPQPIVLTVLSEMAKNKSREVVAESLADTIEKINKDLQSYERIQTAVILQQDWTIENGLMTPSMKVKRNEVERIYFEKYRSWYKQQKIIVWE